MNDSVFTPSAIFGEAEAGRSATVLKSITTLHQKSSNVQLDLAELLLEATDSNFFPAWGFSSRKEFVEKNLDMSDGQVRFLTKIVAGAKTLSIPRSDYQHVGVSKLREIFSLDPDEFEDDIRRLLALAPEMSYDEVKNEVKTLKGLVGPEELTWVNFQVSRIVKDNVVIPGLEAWRQYLGSKGMADASGNTEYSDGFCLETLLAEVLSGAPVQGEDMMDEVEFA